MWRIARPDTGLLDPVSLGWPSCALIHSRCGSIPPPPGASSPNAGERSSDCGPINRNTRAVRPTALARVRRRLMVSTSRSQPATRRERGIDQYLSPRADQCLHGDIRGSVLGLPQQLRLEYLDPLIVVAPPVSSQIVERLKLTLIAGAALVVDLGEEVGLGVLVEVVAVGEDVAHDREPVFARGFRGVGLAGGGGRRKGRTRGDGGRGCLAGGVAALEEREGEPDGEQDRDGDGGGEARPGHGTSLGAETARTRMVSGGWLGRSTCSRVSRT